MADNTKARFAGLGSAIALALVVFEAFADTRVELSTGTEFSSVQLADQVKTSIWYTPFSAKLAMGDWSFRALVPYVSIAAPNDVIVLLDDDPTSAGAGRGNPVPTRSSASRRTVSGIGDIPVSATYSMNAIGGSRMYADISSRVRFPTGGEATGIGVGATDYSFTSEVGIDLDHGGAYLSGGRRILGQVSGFRRVNGWQAGAGVSVNLGSRAVMGAYFDWRDASEPGLLEPREAGTYLTVRLTHAWKVRIDASTALEEHGPNYTVEMTLFWRALDRH